MLNCATFTFSSTFVLPILRMILAIWVYKRACITTLWICDDDDSIFYECHIWRILKEHRVSRWCLWISVHIYVHAYECSSITRFGFWICYDCRSLAHSFTRCVTSKYLCVSLKAVVFNICFRYVSFHFEWPISSRS